MPPVRLGIDMGSVSTKVAIVCDGTIEQTLYARHFGKPIETVVRLLSTIENWEGMQAAFTGSASKLAALAAGKKPVPETVALAASIIRFHPEFRSVIEMGGQDSKLLQFHTSNPHPVFDDFSMNSSCAAGTGSFLDQQASRLGLDIAEFGRLALACNCVPRVAGRCSVFAKSDMIHLQQVGIPPEDIAAGLSMAVARNFKSAVAGGREFVAPIGFVGGVAANEGVLRALGQVLADPAIPIMVPPHFHSLTAAGAVLVSGDGQLASLDRHFLEKMDELAHRPTKGRRCEPLGACAQTASVFDMTNCPPEEPVYLGIDVGSVSTNVVALDRKGNLVAREYLPTAGMPLEAVKRGLAGMAQKLGRDRKVLAAGTTGSGRRLTAEFIGADTVSNEITAQATAAVAADPGVDTVFEIGGQDSKYISIKNGRVVEFDMNRVCAAGTGSFLEEQAIRLGLDIRDFGSVALQAPFPSSLGERCTVFMEGDVVSQQTLGTSTDNIAGGLCYSIVHNYLHKVVGDRRIGSRILFQGGTAHNAGVVAAFRSVLGRDVVVPPHHDVTGAIGAALLAREAKKDGPSAFKGFGLTESTYGSRTFTCGKCSNSCEVHQVVFEHGQKACSGGRCERFEGPGPAKGGIDGFLVRERLLLEGWIPPPHDSGRKRIGIPRALWFWEFFPFFRRFFEDLGFDIVLSSASSSSTIRKGLECTPAETCFPIKLALGHVLDLCENQAPDYVFLPSILKPFPHAGFTDSQNCPYMAGSPYILDAGLNPSPIEKPVLTPVLDFSSGEWSWIPHLIKLGKQLGAEHKTAVRACKTAMTALKDFERSLRRAGKEMLSSLGESGRAIVVVSRPYNGCDSASGGGLSRYLSRLGMTVIPADFLDLPLERAAELHANMYWHCGQKILAAALAVHEDNRLHAAYLTNFGCGPDSFIHHFFTEIMGEKPFLTIETDEHSAGAGMITRCEAFLDTLGADKTSPASRARPSFWRENGTLAGRTVWIPGMGDGARLIAAAVRGRGMDARPMPATDAESVSLGRGVTSGKECYPAIITSGNMLKILRHSEPHKNAFFMGTASGPCRFGQYCAFHRLVLDKQGYSEVPILTSSSSDSYSSVLGLSSFSFQLALRKSLICSDLLRRALCRVRPYAASKENTDSVYEEALSSLEESLMRRRSVLPILSAAARSFSRLLQNSAPKPRVLLFGEIYIRNDPYANGWIANRIEDLGGEVVPASVMEWFEYVRASYTRKSLTSLQAKKAVRGLFEGALIRVMRKSLEAPFHSLLQGRNEPDTGEILRAARPYLKENVGGESILCIGSPVARASAGNLHGAVNIFPFTCLPGTIVTAISKRLRLDHPNLPWLNLTFDGQEDTNNETRLAAFMFQTRARFGSKT